MFVQPSPRRSYRGSVWFFVICFTQKRRLGGQVDRRRVTRHRVLKSGMIVLPSGGAISCIVRNISTTGATIEVESPVGIPENFTLIVGKDIRPCQVAWGKGKRMGVRFEPYAARK